MRFELCACERALIEEIARPLSVRNDVASTYGLAIRSGEEVNWARVNEAIIDRWSMSALIYIKDRAWKHLNGTI